VAIGNGCIADEVFKGGSLQGTRHHFRALRKGEAALNCRFRCKASRRELQLSCRPGATEYWPRSGWVEWVGSRQTDLTAALRWNDTSEHGPRSRRWIERGCCLGPVDRYLSLAGL
jgi:hypothetical protein